MAVLEALRNPFVVSFVLAVVFSVFAFIAATALTFTPLNNVALSESIIQQGEFVFECVTRSCVCCLLSDTQARRTDYSSRYRHFIARGSVVDDVGSYGHPRFFFGGEREFCLCG